MKNRHVQELFSSSQIASKQLARANEIFPSLYSEISRLTAENNELKKEAEGVLTQRFVTPDLVGPSDSVSNFSSATSSIVLASRAATRPAQYPLQVLWTIEDCKTDPAVGLSIGNESRPPMNRAIRHADGTMITPGEYSAIRASARKYKTFLLALATPRGLEKAKKTMTYFRNHHAAEWQRVVRELEAEQPLLALCASNWKSEHILCSVLQHNTGKGTPANAQKQKKAPSRGNRPKPTDPKLSGDSDWSDEGDNRPNLGSPAGKDCADGTKKMLTGDTPRAVNSTHTNPPSIISDPLNPPFLARRISPQLGAQTGGHVEVSFIEVDDSIDNLIAVLSKEFPILKDAQELLISMQDNPSFKSGPSSADVQALLERIEHADPNACDLDEDDSNASWGHSQFTGGSLTCTSVLTSWENIGSTGTARRFIAAALKTCKIARHLCFARKITTSTYLSDSYLEKIIELIWAAWKEAGGIPAPADESEDNTATDTVNAGNTRVLPDNEEPVDGGDSARLPITALTKDEIVQWMKVNGIPAPAGKKNRKEDFINAVASAPVSQQPSQAAVDAIVQERKEKRAAARKHKE
ncbi:hypothetical protein BV25DRAFT_1838394 [Artomyces pyxidatus]|uniref:Uncharacterized protein n=1 Tax=Artomyces pyxidatus TaxID=48021 RepID=A0ACB8T384_9AGAM|nr:hypothetical protein BV25DRAFT_1838394 [Artomyces pyxidatus]